MVTMSVREGLLCPAFCVLSVSIVISVVGGGVSAGGVFVSNSVGVREGGWPSGGGVLLQWSSYVSAAGCAELEAVCKFGSGN